ncbi:MAG: T9SS type A sorting domain-containing protein [Bacteroidales bacterium]|nr:T9SS type A sorting domain-containing protein [Bacteroidales bacterium]
MNALDDVYVNGSFRGGIEEGDFKVKSAGFSSDAFVAKYTNEGQFRFIEAIGDTNTDFAGRMLIDSLNYIYLTGNYNQNMKVLNDTTEKGAQEDFYLTKLYDCDFSPKIKLPNDTSVCEAGFVIVADSGFSKYLWNEMGGDYRYAVDTTGRYYLKAYDEQGCITADTIYVRINKPLQVDLGNDLRVKQGELVMITTNDQFEEYLWSTSENTPYIQMVTDELKPGGYPIGITTKDAHGCITRDQLLLEVEGLVAFNIYPVPAKHTVSLLVQNIEPDKNIDYQLVTESGSVVFNEAQISVGNSFTKEIDIQNLEPGVYYLKVRYEELTSTLKVIKM